MSNNAFKVLEDIKGELLESEGNVEIIERLDQIDSKLTAMYNDFLKFSAFVRSKDVQQSVVVSAEVPLPEVKKIKIDGLDELTQDYVQDNRRRF